jgi:hypothetical protein
MSWLKKNLDIILTRELTNEHVEGVCRASFATRQASVGGPKHFCSIY